MKRLIRKPLVTEQDIKTRLEILAHHKQQYNKEMNELNLKLVFMRAKWIRAIFYLGPKWHLHRDNFINRKTACS